VRELSIGEQPISIEDVVDLAQQRASLRLEDSPAFRERVTRGAELLDRILEEDGVIYGVTTGYGDSCTVDVPADLAAAILVSACLCSSC
jgi:histidine ammonia-lyase